MLRFGDRRIKDYAMTGGYLSDLSRAAEALKITRDLIYSPGTFSFFPTTIGSSGGFSSADL
jgi:hypothetical protein